MIILLCHAAMLLSSIVNCSENFYFDDTSGICVPECGTWVYATQSMDKILTIIHIVGTLAGISITCVIITASLFRHKKM